MNKVKVAIVTIGHMPPNLNRKKFGSWESSVFELAGEIESYSLPIDSDGGSWEYTDDALEEVLPENHNGDFLIAIANVPVEDNYFARVIAGNKVVFTFHETKEILSYHNIPLENVIFLMIYTCVLIYIANEAQGNKIASMGEWSRFFHDETRGCLFDMNGIKREIIYACDSPVICSDCMTSLRKEKVSIEAINTVGKEIKRIRKPLFYRVHDFIKIHPIFSLLITAISALVIGVVGSVIGSYIYEIINKA